MRRRRHGRLLDYEEASLLVGERLTLRLILDASIETDRYPPADMYDQGPKKSNP
jgi:hypothetical protein